MFMATCNERVRKMRKNLIMCGIPSPFAVESIGLRSVERKHSTKIER